MAIRQLRYQEDEILRKKCKMVAQVDDKIRLYLEDMMDTLHASGNGAALAANQAGILRRLVVIDYNGYYCKLVNPEITESSGSQECVEACLSFPGLIGKTVRPMHVTVRALDETGTEITLQAEGEMAKCFCHEIDHLDGRVFTDKVTEWINDWPE